MCINYGSIVLLITVSSQPKGPREVDCCYWPLSPVEHGMFSTFFLRDKGVVLPW